MVAGIALLFGDVGRSLAVLPALIGGIFFLIAIREALRSDKQAETNR